LNISGLHGYIDLRNIGFVKIHRVELSYGVNGYRSFLTLRSDIIVDELVLDRVNYSITSIPFNYVKSLMFKYCEKIDLVDEVTIDHLVITRYAIVKDLSKFKVKESVSLNDILGVENGKILLVGDKVKVDLKWYSQGMIKFVGYSENVKHLKLTVWYDTMTSHLDNLPNHIQFLSIEELDPSSNVDRITVNLVKKFKWVKIQSPNPTLIEKTWEGMDRRLLEDGSLILERIITEDD
jgi:hypothetical protein